MSVIPASKQSERTAAFSNKTQITLATAMLSKWMVQILSIESTQQSETWPKVSKQEWT